MSRILSDRRVLVVEDEMLIVLMIEDMLEDLGCKSVCVASTSAHAVELVEDQLFDVAMLDMNLGGKDSGEVAVALVAQGVPFFYCTGNSPRDTADRVGDRTVLRKPFSFEELTASLTRLLPD